MGCMAILLEKARTLWYLGYWSPFLSFRSGNTREFHTLPDVDIPSQPSDLVRISSSRYRNSLKEALLVSRLISDPSRLPHTTASQEPCCMLYCTSPPSPCGCHSCIHLYHPVSCCKKCTFPWLIDRPMFPPSYTWGCKRDGTIYGQLPLRNRYKQIG